MTFVGRTGPAEKSPARGRRGTPKLYQRLLGMDEDFALIRNRQLNVTRAFEGACEKLGIGLGSLDVWRRELVTQIAQDCAAAGDVPLETLQARIVSEFLWSERQRSADQATRDWPTR